MVERQREREVLAALQARGEEEAARAESLAAQVREAREERLAERAGRRLSGAALVARGHSAVALARSNGRIAEECEELRAELVRVRDEGAELERACPDAEDRAAHDWRECRGLRAELQAESCGVERHEQEAANL